MKTLHEVYVNTLARKIKYKPLNIYQNDNAEYIDFIFDADVLDCDIQIRALLPNNERFSYTVRAERFDIVTGSPGEEELTARDIDEGFTNDVEIVTMYKVLWHIPCELLEVNGYVAIEVKTLSADGITTIGAFGINVKEELFNKVFVSTTMPIADTFVVDSMKCY